MTVTARAESDAVAPAAPLQSVYRPAKPVDLLRTVGVLRRGPNDPTTVIDGPVIWRAVRTPVGVATLALRESSGEIRATAWGAGASHALDTVPTSAGRATMMTASTRHGIR